jgi:sialic acid synthase SpsE
MNRTHIIAEMACSHEGDPALARKIIDGAGEAGADSIQFQIWSLKDTVVPHHPDYQMLTRIELSRDAWRDLANYVRDKYPAMQIIACVYERSSVDFAQSIDVDAYKIHSADLSNPVLINYVAQQTHRSQRRRFNDRRNAIGARVDWRSRYVVDVRLPGISDADRRDQSQLHD